MGRRRREAEAVRFFGSSSSSVYFPSKYQSDSFYNTEKCNKILCNIIKESDNDVYMFSFKAIVIKKNFFAR